MKRTWLGAWLVVVVVVASSCSSDTGPELSALAAEGRDLTLTHGCAACHGEDGAGVVGAPWIGLLGSTVDLEDGTAVVADSEYIRRAIVDPDADIAAGYTISMPLSTLTDAEIDAVVAYIEELQ